MNKLAAREHYVPTDQAISCGVVVLVVGDVHSLKAHADADIAGDDMAIADYADVTHELIDALQPQIVMSSVLGRNFDCVDLAEKLDGLGFDGRYRLIGHGMPQPDLVLREIRSLFPRLNVEMDGGAA